MLTGGCRWSSSKQNCRLSCSCDCKTSSSRLETVAGSSSSLGNSQRQVHNGGGSVIWQNVTNVPCVLLSQGHSRTVLPLLKVRLVGCHIQDTDGSTGKGIAGFTLQQFLKMSLILYIIILSASHTELRKETVASADTILSIWRPVEDLDAVLVEGRRLHISNLAAAVARFVTD